LSPGNAVSRPEIVPSGSRRKIDGALCRARLGDRIDLFEQAKEVIYGESVAMDVTNPEHGGGYFLFMKRPQWSNEEEVQLVRPRTKHNVPGVIIQPEWLTRIILGRNISQENERPGRRAGSSGLPGVAGCPPATLERAPYRLPAVEAVPPNRLTAFARPPYPHVHHPFLESVFGPVHNLAVDAGILLPRLG
jgi:hypothetical protein